MLNAQHMAFDLHPQHNAHNVLHVNRSRLDKAPFPFFFTGKSVHCALLLPMSGAWPVGRYIAGAAALAVTRVNADTKLLHGRTLRYSWADSGCSAKQGLVAMGELLEDDRIDSLIGPACSSACEVTSYLSAGRGIPQISWGCTSPTLSEKNEHHMVRTNFT